MGKDRMSTANAEIRRQARGQRMPADTTGHQTNHEHTLQELRESEARFRTLAESSPLAVFVNREDKVLLANQACVKLFGAASPDELIGREALGLFAPESRPLVQERIRVDSEEVPLVEVQIVRLDGTAIDVEATASPFLDQGVKAIQVLLRDITERKAADEALRRSASFLESLIDYASAPIIVWDTDLKVTRFNHAFERLAQRTSDEVVGHALDLLFPVEFREQSLAQIGLAGRGESLENADIPILRADGEIRTVLWSSADVYDSASGETLLAVIAQGQDITERKAAEETLKRSEQNLNLSVGRVGTWNWDLVTDALEWSPRAKAMFGLPEDAHVTHESFLAALHAEDRDGADAAIKEALAGKTDCDMEYRAVWPDGTISWIYDLGRAYEDAAGTPVRMAGSMLDITERKAIEEELRERTEELLRSNTELEKFAYVASHDLQEPLRMVTNYTQLLQRRYQGKLDSDADEFIAYAVDGAARMRVLINELLAYSRVGTQGAPFVLTDLESLLDDVLQGLEVALLETHAIVTRDPLPELWCDPTQIARVFQNLIVNAVKFHGTVPPEVHVGARKAGQEWVFSVSDNGIGIEPEYFERIFVIFQRLQSRVEYEGTGMGLAIGKRIIERHGGRIWVESQPGAGSTFFFTLPADQKEPE
jgi:PAS domain S-box-containing protein